ncbi:MAG TPA: divergent polysaccharide deacetylase family protein [Geomonas sp.]
MARKGKAVNRHKPSGGGRRPLLALALVVVLIALAFFLLERTRRTVPPPPVVTGEIPAPHLKLPARPAPQQQKISSVSLPAAKPQAPVHPRAAGPGSLAIIIDDMGASMQELQALLSIKLPLTFSVIPSLARAKGVAGAAHAAGAEVMVHLPMEPQGYPKQPMEKIGLLLSMDDDEIEKRVSGYFGFVPYAVGANNHMGSRFTESAEKMEVVLRVLKGKGIFFVDSRTSPASVGYRTARELGLRCGTRQVFLDNVQDEAAIGKQLLQAAAIARKSGSAIAICHPHPATIRALKAMMPQLAQQGITFVHASKIVNGER